MNRCNRPSAESPELVAAGLDGIECFHTKHNAAAAERYQKIAREYGLLITGGSDCHGMSKGKPLIGTVKLDYRHVENLYAAKKSADAKRATTPAT